MAAKKKASAKKTARKVVVRKKASVKKSATKKASAAKASVRKVKPAPKKAVIVKSAFNKTQLFTTIAEELDMPKKQVSQVFESLSSLIDRHMKAKTVGEFTLPGLLKIRLVRKPATKARKGINPFTGEETMFKAKPARNVVKIKALKKLKDMVA